MGRTATAIAVTGFALVCGSCGSSRDRDRSEGGVRATSAQVEGAGTATIELTSRKRQPIEGWGTAVTTDQVFDPWGDVGDGDPVQARELDRLTLRAGINLVRVFAPGPQQGRGDVAVWPADDGRLALGRRLARRNVRFMMTGNFAPSAMLVNGGPYGRLKPGSEADYAEFLASCLQAAARAGVRFHYAGVGNEVDNEGASGRFLSREQAATVIAMLAGEIRDRGLDTRVVLGDTTNWASTLEYASAQYDGLPRDQIAFVATHGYGGEDRRPELARFARQRALPLWMTEWVSACPQGDCGDNPSIEFALRWATRITEDLTIADARAWFMFRGVADSTHGADGAIIVRTRANGSQRFTPTKRYPVLRQFTIAAPRGVRRVDTTGGAASDVLRVGFVSRRRRALVLTNTSQETRAVKAVLSTKAGRLQTWRTSASQNLASLRTRSLARGNVKLELPPQSVTTLVYRERP